MITDLHRQSFERDGFLQLDLELPVELIDSARNDFLALYEAGDKDNRLFNGWKSSKNIESLALNNTIIQVLSELYGMKPRPFQTLNFLKGTEQKAHSDSIHFNTQPFGRMCGVWIALEDINEKQGPLIYYPGSHLLAEFNMPDIGLRGNRDDYPKYEDYVESLIENNRYPKKLGVLKKGEIIIWAANLIHGGSPHQNKSLTRLSQVNHYFFPSKYYWQPLSSKRARSIVEPPWLDGKYGNPLVRVFKKAYLHYRNKYLAR
ncbi:phytanoyl-CoA dioxygenase family protein [Psychrosphaera haliotis]|uniref:Phytanoyl-CoA dioxygenase n=1 Tax=Psychrosphaera haliotis TaxID=555083 RepID=A0A6N8F6V6_9GAMM|nr:phytanoyl-CoA dioxygenase family protein [Psychrosphaera haliotis]MUH71948.1 hypothetical protein [Psychrosphaera haliotis]